MSVHIATEWHVDAGTAAAQSPYRVLIFSHISESRDRAALLSALATALKQRNIQIVQVLTAAMKSQRRSRASGVVEDPAILH